MRFSLMKLITSNNCGNFKSSYKEELSLFKTDFGIVRLMIGLLFFILLPIAGNSHLLKMLSMAGIYSIAAIGLNILTGYTGMISLGHAAIFGIGAYSAAILTNFANAPLWFAVPAGGAISLIAGLGFSLPALRLPGFYLCFATLAGQKIMEYMFVRCTRFIGGAGGMSVTKTGFLGMDPKNVTLFYYVTLIFLFIMLWMADNILRSKFGRAFSAIRANRKAADAIGIPVLKYKTLSFAISSFYMGIAGALFVYYNLSITPGLFNLSFSFMLIAMIVIGGLGSLPGSLFGAIFVVVLKEAFVYGDRQIAVPLKLFGLSFTLSSLSEISVGILLILFIIFKPKGLADVWQKVIACFSSWPLLKFDRYDFKRTCTPDK
jgi:branched-chain amino acid transport system permease protein